MLITCPDCKTGVSDGASAGPAPLRYGLSLSLALLFALSAARACQKSGDDNAVGHRAAPRAMPTINVVADQVDGLTLQAKGQPPVELARKNGSWFIETPPPESPAKASAVADILANLAGVKLTESVAATATDQLLATYELTPAQSAHVVARAGSAVVADLWIGKMASRGQMVRVEGSPGIWAARGVSSSLYMQSVDRFQAPSPEQAAAAEASRQAAAEAARTRWSSMPTTLSAKLRKQAWSDLSQGVATPAMDVITAEIGKPDGSYDAGMSKFFVWGAQLGGSPTMDEMKGAPFSVRTMPGLTCADYAPNMVEFYASGKRIWPG